MKKYVLSIFLLISIEGPALAGKKGLEAALMRLDPSTRLEQLCDIEAMQRIRREQNSYKPDRAVLAATTDPVTAGHTIKGTGGAFRSKGKWYNFSFKCEATDDHMKVLSFDYKVGEAIPENQLSKDGLWE